MTGFSVLTVVGRDGRAFPVRARPGKGHRTPSNHTHGRDRAQQERGASWHRYHMIRTSAAGCSSSWRGQQGTPAGARGEVDWAATAFRARILKTALSLRKVLHAQTGRKTPAAADANHDG